MKKIAMSVLFAVAAAVLFVGTSFALDYYGVEVFDNAPEINVSSHISVVNNVFQPGSASSVTFSTTAFLGNIGGSHILISTDTKMNIGNITANGNRAIIDGLHFNSGGQIYGSRLDFYTNGSVGNVNASQNYVSIKDLTVNYYLYELAAARIDILADTIGNIAANANKIEINAGQILNCFGAYLSANIASSSASLITVNLNNNEVLVTSSTAGLIRGGWIEFRGIANAISDNNKITISYSTQSNAFLGGDVTNYSGFAKKGSSQTNNNSISISNSVLYAGNNGGLCQGDNAIANGNNVSIEDSSGNVYACGAVVDWAGLSGKANKNSVFIKNTTSMQGDVYGAIVRGGDYYIGYGGFEANENSVVLENITNSGNINVFGAYNEIYAGIGKVNQNSVYIANSNLNTNSTIYGGCIESYEGDLTAELYANGNSVTVESSTVNTIFGGCSYSRNTCLAYDPVSDSTYGDGHTLNVANGNTVSVIGGSCLAVTGGSAESQTSNARANNNSVSLENISGTIYSVMSVMGGFAYGKFDGGKVEAINNTVTITGGLISNNVIYGGFAENSGSGGADYFTGNTLNVKNGNILVRGIGGFENYNFYVENSNINAADPIIFATDGNGFFFISSYANGAVDISSVNINVFLPKGANLTAGDKIALIQSGLAFSGTLKNSQIIAKQGAAWRNTFDLYIDSKTLYASFAGKDFDPKTKSLSEGAAAGAALACGGLSDGDLLSDVQSGNLEAVGAISGRKSKYNTGSSVDMNSIGAAAGIAKKFKSITAGIFVEYANGSFDTDAENTKGSGKASTIGGGIAVKKEIKENVYIDGLIRAGQLSNDCKTDLTDEFKTHADFDYTSMYFGVSLGADYISKVSEKISLDFSGKYMFTDVGGDEVNLPTDDKYKVDAVISNRLKAGVKGEYNVSDSFKPYVAVSYDYELSGDINAKIDGHDIEAPSLNGGTLSGGIGLSENIAKKLTLDISAQGYTGAREGFSGILKLKYEI